MTTHTIALDELLKVVESSKRTMTVLVPSQDYYARPGDSVEERISFIDADTFIAQLEELPKP